MEEGANKDIKNDRVAMTLCDPLQYQCVCLCALCGGMLYTLQMFTFSRQKQLRGQAALREHQHCRAANCLTLENQTVRMWPYYSKNQSRMSESVAFISFPDYISFN